MKIILRHVLSYGNHRYYPKCNFSRMICELLGRKSLTVEQINLLQKYTCEIVLE